MSGEITNMFKIFSTVSKVIYDIKSYIMGNNDFPFYEPALYTSAYPLDLKFTLLNEKKYYHPKDENGLPLRIYTSIGKQYNPTRIAAYGLAHYNEYLKCGNKKNLKEFLKVANWFVQSEKGIWFYNFKWLSLNPPWISAMAQGEGISVLVRAWLITGKEIYLDKAIQATKPFTKEIKAGGVLSYIDDMPFLEEYPTDRPTHVLNGFLYAVIGISDLERFAGIRVEFPSIKDLLQTLEKKLSLWDLGYWSAYDLDRTTFGFRNPATVSYHRLHISLLTYLGKL